jgi:hypothetical protein
MQKNVRIAKARTASTPGASLRPPPPAIYALRDWTIRKTNGKWYIAPTARFEDKPQWSKPYATLQRATTAIARKIADEVIKRHKRRCEFYGIDD